MLTGLLPMLNERAASHARILRFGLDLRRALARLWALRHSIEAADYDARAFYGRRPLQRLWQQRRHAIVTAVARRAGRTLDVGCGSSIIRQSLNGAVRLDVRQNRVHYMRRDEIPLAPGAVFALPVRHASLDCVICPQVIEHIPADPDIFDALLRVLRPGGLRILGTPDCATIGWRVIEPLYGCRSELIRARRLPG